MFVDLTAELLFSSVVDDLKTRGDRTKTIVNQGEAFFPVALTMCGSAFGMQRVRLVNYTNRFTSYRDDRVLHPKSLHLSWNLKVFKIISP